MTSAGEQPVSIRVDAPLPQNDAPAATLAWLESEGKPTQHVIVVDGVESPYWEYFAEPRTGSRVSTAGATLAADDRATIILVHGFRGDHHGLLLLAAGLSDYRVIVPDLPGFGIAPPFPAGREHSVAEYSAWLAAFVSLVKRDGAPVYLLGHSFGSIVSSAAVAGGLRPEKLILVNPIGAPALSGPRGILTQFAVFYYWLGTKLPERVGYALLKSSIITRVSSVAMAKTRDRALRAWIHGQHDEYFSAFANRTVVLESFRASVSHDVSEFSERISVPTVLIAAEKDDITALSAQRTLVKRFQDGRLRVINSVGHLVHYEKPAEAVRYVREFLDS
ncbi:alpha/beta fold hydrolase [Lysinibacter cavernae]|uniref:Pimeloyl-ACP methyl ester carboxylesterase n=1 Tax=Lysinibacter cavernae TaxID=1640652 RepID=A0A7X5QZS7_9MICO|nr:alpha/beta hydrolase [Lysinibacter cavernae]NIH52802.1 pimeloyl-ACP methyl ester carboxylesterase [Lysinibacter cavernae]